MRALELPKSPGWILSFDFDDTLHNPGGSPPVPEEFFEQIVSMREQHAVVWGINTGRSMEHVLEGLLESRFPFSPDWVVAREREIRFQNSFGRWVGDDQWNKRCAKDHKKFFKKVSKVLTAIRSEVEEHTGASWIEMEGDPAGIISRNDDEMDWIVGRIKELVSDTPLLGWQRNSIYLRFGHKNYQKGSSLRRVAERYSLGPKQSFAIGDGHNDFEMLSPDSAVRIACPANAATEVQAHVKAVGGYVATSGHGHGVIEALRHFFD